MAETPRTPTPTVADMVASARAMIVDGIDPLTGEPIAEGMRLVVDDTDGAIQAFPIEAPIIEAPIIEPEPTVAPEPVNRAIITMIVLTPPTPRAWSPDPAVRAENALLDAADRIAYEHRAEGAYLGTTAVRGCIDAAVAAAVAAAERTFRRFVYDALPGNVSADLVNDIIPRIAVAVAPLRGSVGIDLIAANGKARQARGAQTRAVTTAIDAIGHPSRALVDGATGYVDYTSRDRVASGRRTIVYTGGLFAVEGLPQPFTSASTTGKMAVQAIDPRAEGSVNGWATIHWDAYDGRTADGQDEWLRKNGLLGANPVGVADAATVDAIVAGNVPA